MQRLYRKLPELIQAILINSQGWLVGSAVKNTIEGNPITDFDIIVEDRNLYMRAVSYLKAGDFDFSVNSFGGVKFCNSNLNIDIWPNSLDDYIKKANKFDYAYNMSRNILIQNVD